MKQNDGFLSFKNSLYTRIPFIANMGRDEVKAFD